MPSSPLHAKSKSTITRGDYTHRNTTYIYESPWDVVVKAYQLRFERVPHPKIPALVSAEVIDCWYEDTQRDLVWRVKGMVKPPLPDWILSLAAVKNVEFHTTNRLSYDQSRFTVHVKNVSYEKSIDIQENNAFYPHPENPQWTVYRQEAKMKIFKWMAGLGRKVEDTIMRMNAKSFNTARHLDEEFIVSLKQRHDYPSIGFLEQLALQRLDMEQPTRHEEGTTR